MSRKHIVRIEMANDGNLYFESNRDAAELKKLGRKIEDLIGADFIELFDESDYIEDEEVRDRVTEVLGYGHDRRGYEYVLGSGKPMPEGGVGWFYTEGEVSEAWMKLLKIVDPGIEISEVPNPIPTVYDYSLEGIVGDGTDGNWDEWD